MRVDGSCRTATINRAAQHRTVPHRTAPGDVRKVVPEKKASHGVLHSLRHLQQVFQNILKTRCIVRDTWVSRVMRRLSGYSASSTTHQISVFMYSCLTFA